MKWLTFEIRREPGFRFNLLDLILLCALLVASVVWHALYPGQGLYLLPLYVGASFFLFCNVFRIGNRFEAPWYLLFVAITAYGLTRDRFPWVQMLMACEAAKWTLITYRIVRGPYRGILHQWVNRGHAVGAVRGDRCPPGERDV